MCGANGAKPERDNGIMRTYLTVYFGSVVLAIVITPIIIRFAQRHNIVDAPNIRKIHSRPVPRIGGIAIFLSMMGLVIPVLVLPNVIGHKFRLVQFKLLVLLSMATFMFLVGLWDDIKGLRVRAKLLAQFICATIVCCAGIRINSIGVTDSLVIHFGWFSWPLTIFWIVGISNAINFVDGLDGLAAGICAATCGVIVILTLHFGSVVMAIMMLALLGALSGFLVFNFSPAKIFMGDCGSLFLGFTIASSSVLCAAKTETVVGLALPTLALGIPIFDTLFSMLRRFLERRSVFSPDRSHFHHRLLSLGLRHRHAVIAIYGLTLLATGLGMFMLFTGNAQTIMVFACIMLMLVMVFRIVGSVRLQETMAGLKRRHAIAHETKRELEDFENIELHFRQAQMFEQWWDAVCFAAHKMGFARGVLPLTNRNGSKQTLTWEQDNEDIASEKLVTMTLPLRDRRSDSLLNLEMQIHTNGSLESVGRRFALFTRLIEEHSVVSLPRSGIGSTCVAGVQAADN